MSRRLSPIDIQHAEFARTVSGYDRREVRAFLERLSVEVEAYLREAQALRQKLDAAEARMEELKATEAELQRAVMAAERIAADMKEVARKEAQLILQDADHQREARLRGADESLQGLRTEVARLEHQRKLFKEQFRGLLQAYLKGLDAEDEALGALLDDTVQP